MNSKNSHLILGSGSPRRQQLLRDMGWEFEIRIRNTEEIFPQQLREEQVALHLAELKSMAFDEELKPGEIVLTADTIVCKDGKVYNKPSGKTEALQMLRELNGKSHKVYTGVCISSLTARECFTVESTVHFNLLSEVEIEDYVLRFQPYDKAGSYGAQECLPAGFNPCSEEENKFLEQNNLQALIKMSINTGADKNIALISAIDGSFFNVMGLPIVQLNKHMESFLLN